jgi:hypothetical protein
VAVTQQDVTMRRQQNHVRTPQPNRRPPSANRFSSKLRAAMPGTVSCLSLSGSSGS